MNPRRLGLKALVAVVLASVTFGAFAAPNRHYKKHHHHHRHVVHHTINHR
jgi:hypothetical protein